MIAIIARRPDVLTHPQFYAEDGSVWYSNAYNFGGLYALALPEGGYLNTLPRLVAWFSLLVPLHDAPLIMNVCGIIIQALPASFLLSQRCSMWASAQTRVLLAVTYIVLPNSREVHVVLTNAQFHLALLALLVTLARPPQKWPWKLFDIVVLILCGLTGPFCIVLLVITAMFWLIRRQQWSLWVAGILLPSVLVQGLELLLGGQAVRAPGYLGASPMLFLRILSGQVYVGSLHGRNGFALTASTPLVLLVALLGTAILLYCVQHEPIELKLIVTFSFLILAASLSRPLISGDAPLWQLLASDRGGRYWFFPMLAFLWSLVWCAVQNKGRKIGVFATALLVFMLDGVILDWRYPPYPCQDLQEAVSGFNATPKGTIVDIPVYPPGMFCRLEKK